MNVPNTLFYNNTIKCGYVPNSDKQFMYSQKPFLFIDVPDGKESLNGTSFMNQKEVDVITEFTKEVLKQFNEGNSLHEKYDWPIQKFLKRSI